MSKLLPHIGPRRCSCSSARRAALAQGVGPTPEALYQQQKKSVALAVTLEALCPIAGAGALYAGDGDKGTLLAILSTASAGRRSVRCSGSFISTASTRAARAGVRRHAERVAWTGWWRGRRLSVDADLWVVAGARRGGNVQRRISGSGWARRRPEPTTRFRSQSRA